ncbi:MULTISPECIES: hypothetical protein [unclassified Bacteroides]|uniref:hypothetical protein n=1 Tax=unclassified Bacteroides TaxID=2646097 RepID=UPI0004E12810|nr:MULTISPECIES: hypothetical protein [unclassified Bacteroides]
MQYLVKKLNISNLACLYAVFVVLMFSACDFRRMTEQLDTISKISDTNADSACSLLKKYESEVPNWGKGDRMHYELIKMKIENKQNVVFTSDSLIKQIVDYYKDNGSPNEQMLAYYLLGRVYYHMGEAPQALQAYYDALEKADTTRADCDIWGIAVVYSQMSEIFHQQNLPNDEIWALKNYCKYTKIVKTPTDYAIAKSFFVAPYFLLEKNDTVLHIIKTYNEELQQLGDTGMAVRLNPTAIYVYTKRKQLDKAEQLIRNFEEKSGLFDEKGNIDKEYRFYYYIKGYYELAANNIDSAEYYFREAIKYGYAYDSYNGMIAIYREKRNVDSIAHYSLLMDNGIDSVRKQIRIDAIHRMASLYNYSRNQKIAEQESQKAHNAQVIIILILSLGVFGSLFVFQLYYSYKRKKQNEIDKLGYALSSAKREYQNIQDELQKLKNSNVERLIEEKERKGKELKQTIESIASEGKMSAATNGLEEFAKSEIVGEFVAKKSFCADSKKPTKAEWKALETQFRKDMPMAYNMLANEKKLSPLELHVCILLILDFEDGIIASITESLPQTVSNAKARANKKIFNESGAQTLKYRLMQLIGAF